jgi:hypothetical protein
MINKSRIPIPTLKGIHNGDVTHHQDHEMVFVNFNTRKTTNKSMGNDIPL